MTDRLGPAVVLVARDLVWAMREEITTGKVQDLTWLRSSSELPRRDNFRGCNGARQVVPF